MTIASILLAPVRKLQDCLNFKGCNMENMPQYATKQGLGRVAILSFMLGVLLGFHICVLLGSVFFSWMRPSGFSYSDDDMDIPPLCEILFMWSLYMIFFCFFHLSEFFVTSIYNPGEASSDSFMVNHSLAYTVAVMISSLEFWIEAFFWPSIKQRKILSIYTGLILVLAGSGCRLLAMATCGPSFNHIIQRTKKDGHELVTYGIYKFLRHPAYFGWFYWSTGTQLILCNPFCTIAYTIAGWTFFQKRIPYEEAILMRQYPFEYPAYMDRTYIGIPFMYTQKLPAATLSEFRRFEEYSSSDPAKSD